MVDNNINEIIANSLKIDKAMLSDNIKSIVPKIKTALNTNSDLIKQSNTIDKNNNNGFIMDTNIINNIINNIEKETIYYGNVTLSQKDDEKNSYMVNK